MPRKPKRKLTEEELEIKRLAWEKQMRREDKLLGDVDISNLFSRDESRVITHHSPTGTFNIYTPVAKE